jgi:alpha-aminoadipate carrier protein LysW
MLIIGRCLRTRGCSAHRARRRELTVVECPECAAEITLGEDLIIGEILECPDCGVELEVTQLDPVEIDLAPEEEEDWGE